MATTETLNVQLVSGGEVSLIVEADFLMMSKDDFGFVRELVTMVRLYSMPSTTVAASRAPKPKTAAPFKPRASAYDRAEVARVANAAVRAGESMRRAVALRFGITENSATKQIKLARQHGHHIEPGRVGRPPKSATSGNVSPVVKAVPRPGARAFTPDDTLKLL